MPKIRREAPYSPSKGTTRNIAFEALAGGKVLSRSRLMLGERRLIALQDDRSIKSPRVMT